MSYYGRLTALERKNKPQQISPEIIEEIETLVGESNTEKFYDEKLEKACTIQEVQKEIERIVYNGRF